MTKPSSESPAPDAGCIKFQVREGIRLVTCNVPDEVLEAVAGLSLPSTTASRRKSFDRFRTLIDAAAKLKLKGLPPGFAGPLDLSSRDLRIVPPLTGGPAYGTSPRGG